MTKEEATKYLIRPVATSTEIGEQKRKEFEAYNMAIEALTEPKTIIGIDIPYGSDKGIAAIFKGNEKMVLEEIREIMSVVRCKNCKWWPDNIGYYSVTYCPWDDDIGIPDADDFCSYGERREE